MEKKPKRWLLFLAIGLGLALAVIVLIVIATKPMPVALLKEFSFGTLWEEGVKMNECAECHDGAEFHDCTTCHDDHGAVEMAGIQFYAVVDLTGDVPDPSFVRINEVLPNQENADTHITVQDLLAQTASKNLNLSLSSPMMAVKPRSHPNILMKPPCWCPT